ncbi:MAG: carbon storage regulator CsrA [Candidatus Marinimicrobia bacterium]|nr:carbon storage regulator CsrA [Candidatus Neomarinimicrobiota bacterium]MCF7841124.1 carbon storage regulator CsrA [Candidatus Neomarinimicrobiota bacterium]MCF7901786.1 carbon storage regulator CsrA [Candidatus Neomarinimicrobiota bacterium]
MLVLTRKAGESFRIGTNVIISVIKTSSGQVKLGVVAPENIAVHREEIYQKIREENQAATAASGSFSTEILGQFL